MRYLCGHGRATNPEFDIVGGMAGAAVEIDSEVDASADASTESGEGEGGRFDCDA